MHPLGLLHDLGHRFIESGQDFGDWIKNRPIMGLIEGDYEGVTDQFADEAYSTFFGNPEEGELPGLLGGITVFHATPNIWTPASDLTHQGIFDLSKMGSGEGAQVRGWGGYFAENPKTAEDYYQKFNTAESYKYGDKLVAPNGKETKLHDTFADPGYQAAGRLVRKHKGDFAAALEDNWQEAKKRGGAKKDRFIYTGQYEDLNPYAEAAAYLKDWRDMGMTYKPTEAALYKFELPDEQLPGLLDLDTTIDEQPVLNSKLKSIFDKEYNDTLEENILTTPDYTGEEVQQKLRTAFSNNKQRISEYLDSLGIPGNKFFDQGSREGPYKATFKQPGVEGFITDYFESPENAKAFADSWDQELVKIEKIPQTRNFVIWNQGLLEEMPALERLK